MPLGTGGLRVGDFMARAIERRRVCIALAVLATGGALGYAAPAAEADAMRNLALQGYDPVAYFTLGKATPGDPQFEYAWAGAVYRFASARDMALFKIGPERYLPQFDSLCTGSLAAGRKYPGDPRNWLIQDGRLYLFGSAAARAQMARDPAATKARADAAWAKLSTTRR